MTSSSSLFFLLLLTIIIIIIPFTNPNPNSPTPSPSPSPISCEHDLNGVGSFETLCTLSSQIEISHDVITISGAGSLLLLPGSSLSCSLPSCSISGDLSGNLTLSSSSSILASSIRFSASNITIQASASLNTTGLAGDPPEKTSGAGTGTHGDGGGHGGRGASCFVKEGGVQEDSWGGDPYAWDTLEWPGSYGSKGGTTSLESDYGAGGGGIVKLVVGDLLVVDGEVCADGGNGGPLGGGGSGGSIYIVANKM